MIKKIILVGFVMVLLLGLFSNFAKATDQETLNKQIKEYEEQIAKLQGQANTLKNQIAQFNAKINLTSLQITQTQEKIALLGTRIDLLEGSLSSLSTAFSSRAVATYKMARSGETVYLLFNNENLSQTISKFHYLQKAQEADHELLVRLQSAQNNYKKDKGEEEKLQHELEKQKAQLATQKVAKDQLLAVTKNDEKKYQELLAQAKAQLAAFRRFVTGQGGATILSNQTKCDGWGCYYNQRDSQWGNQAIGNSDSSMKEYGCLVTSMAMVASHYGKSLKPSEIAATSSVFFGNTAFMNQGYWNAAGVGMTRTRVCTNCGIDTTKQKIDEEVNAGRPVVIGLYSGPDHFIVIKKKEGDSYIMNDPFLENGSDKPLTTKYNVSDIKTVDIVRVN